MKRFHVRSLVEDLLLVALVAGVLLGFAHLLRLIPLRMVLIGAGGWMVLQGIVTVFLYVLQRRRGQGDECEKPTLGWGLKRLGGEAAVMGSFVLLCAMSPYVASSSIALALGATLVVYFIGWTIVWWPYYKTISAEARYVARAPVWQMASQESRGAHVNILRLALGHKAIGALVHWTFISPFIGLALAGTYTILVR